MPTLSGQITVTTAETPVQGPEGLGGEYILRAHPDNTGAIYVGNDGNDTVDADTGFVLDPGDFLVFDQGRVWRDEGLSSLWVDAETSGNKLCWILV